MCLVFTVWSLHINLPHYGHNTTRLPKCRFVRHASSCLPVTIWCVKSMFLRQPLSLLATAACFAGVSTVRCGLSAQSVNSLLFYLLLSFVFYINLSYVARMIHVHVRRWLHSTHFFLVHVPVQCTCIVQSCTHYCSPSFVNFLFDWCMYACTCTWIEHFCALNSHVAYALCRIYHLRGIARMWLPHYWCIYKALQKLYVNIIICNSKCRKKTCTIVYACLTSHCACPSCWSICVFSWTYHSLMILTTQTKRRDVTARAVCCSQFMGTSLGALRKCVCNFCSLQVVGRARTKTFGCSTS